MRINLHIVRNGVTQDSRVLKETATLQKAGLFESVEIAGFEQDGLPEREEVNGCHTWRIRIASRSLPKDLLSQSIKYWEWKYRLVKAYRSAPLSVIHCNDLGPLPIAVTLKRLTGALLVYDAHELETEKLGNQGIRKLWAKHTERRCMKWVDAMITVSPSIVQWYRNQYPGAPVSLVRNVPIKPSKAQSPMNLRAKFHVPENSLLFLYQGGLSRGRGIEHIVATFSTGDLPHHVLFMGEGPMTEEVKTAANRNHNIHWLPPVAPGAVLQMTAGADIGLSMLEDVALNHRYALPNKLFEYWMAGLPVIVSALPEQINMVEKYRAGWVAPIGRSAFLTFLKSLNCHHLDLVRSGVELARRELSWQKEQEELLVVYRKLTSSLRPASDS